MQEYIDLAFDKSQELLKRIFDSKMKQDLNIFDIEEIRESGSLKGFILYKKDGNKIYISEMFFDTDNPKLFYRSFRKITKGMKIIDATISNYNKPVLNAFKRLGAKSLGDNKYRLVRKAV